MLVADSPDDEYVGVLLNRRFRAIGIMNFDVNGEAFLIYDNNEQSVSFAIGFLCRQ